MERFYRHVLIEGGYPHHGAVAFGNVGRQMFEVMKSLGVTTISFNKPKGNYYPTENPFVKKLIGQLYNGMKESILTRDAFLFVL